jgi:hypothetical protein
MNQDPFASVRLNKPAQQNVPEQQPMQTEQDPFSSVRIKKADERSGLYETGRHATRIGSRIAETIGGIPGDLSALIQSGVITGLQKLTGHELSPEAHEEIKKQRLPTSAELKEFSQEKSGGFTAPENELERFGDELTETVTSLLGPMKFRKALGVATGASLAKEGVKVLGLGEGSQESAKLGTMLLLTAMNPKGALNYASQQYQRANQLAKGASIQATNFRGHLENLRRDLQKGVTTTSKNAVLKPIEDILDKVKQNKILVEDLTAAKRDLNTIMKDPELLTREKKLLKVVGKEIDDAIKPYERINPAFSKSYRPANEIYGAVMQGTKAYDFIRKNLGGKSILGAVLGEVALGHPEMIAPTLGTLGAVAGAAKTGDFFVRLAKSPELQKYYTKALAAAAAEDLPALRVYADKIEEEFNQSSNPPLSPSRKKKTSK